MRVLPCLVLLWVLALAGCSQFGKRSGDDDRIGKNAPDKGPPRFPTGTQDPLFHTPQTTNQANSASLAGQVIDTLDRPLTNAYIQWVSLDEKGNTAPIDQEVGPHGHFYIPGLKSGGHYQLIVRGKQGDRLLAKMITTTAPQRSLVIQVREDLVTPSTPPIPGPPAYQAPKKDDAPKQKAAAPLSPGWKGPEDVSTWAPENDKGKTPPAQNGATPFPSSSGAPAPVLPAPIPVPNPSGPGWVPNIAGKGKEQNWSPLLEIPGQRKSPVLPIPGAGNAVRDANSPPQFEKEKGGAFRMEGETPLPAPAFPSSPSVPSLARVPSCALVGKRLENFALHDVNGEPWELRSQRRGKLVLLDFWYTSCPPCRKTIPHLISLQQKYGPTLEVIGIAYESGSPQEQAHRVAAFSQQMNSNYRQLLGGGARCPLRSQLGILAYPTLILLDQDGQILWRREGLPDRYTLDELERLIQRKL